MQEREELGYPPRVVAITPTGASVAPPGPVPPTPADQPPQPPPQQTVPAVSAQLSNAQPIPNMEQIDRAMLRLQGDIASMSATVTESAIQIERMKDALRAVPCPVPMMTDVNTEPTTRHIGDCLDTGTCNCGIAYALEAATWTARGTR